MAWFFTEHEINGEQYAVSGENAKHISKVLRMRVGEDLTLISPTQVQCTCKIADISSECVTVDVISKMPCKNEPDTFVTLYQALPKGDKMDFIIQKCVELGVSKIVPVLSARCVSRPDKKSLAKKQIRWQKIALQASMQSRRGIVPEVCGCISFDEACRQSAVQDEKTIIFYEMGGEPVKKLLSNKPKKIGMFIGSEGGFESGEVEKILNIGGTSATLGKRILRAETAPLAGLSIIMYESGDFDS